MHLLGGRHHLCSAFKHLRPCWCYKVLCCAICKRQDWSTTLVFILKECEVALKFHFPRSNCPLGNLLCKCSLLLNLFDISSARICLKAPFVLWHRESPPDSVLWWYSNVNMPIFADSWISSFLWILTPIFDEIEKTSTVPHFTIYVFS